MLPPRTRARGVWKPPNTPPREEAFLEALSPANLQPAGDVSAPSLPGNALQRLTPGPRAARPAGHGAGPGLGAGAGPGLGASEGQGRGRQAETRPPRGLKSRIWNSTSGREHTAAWTPGDPRQERLALTAGKTWPVMNFLSWVHFELSYN